MKVGTPTRANLAHLLEWNRGRYGEREALIDLQAGRRISHADLAEDVAALAAGLAERGIGRGDVVSLLGANSVNYLIALLAISARGAIAATINFRLHPSEIGYLVANAGARTLLVDEALESAAEAGKLAEHGIERTILLDGDGAESVDGLIAAHRGAPLEVARVAMEDPQRILHTSGTTSRPKGVTITHGNVQWNFLTQMTELGLTAADRLLIAMPLFHVAALDGPGMSVLHVGGTLVISAAADPETLLRAIEVERVTGSILATPTSAALAEAALAREVDASSLRFLKFGGLPPEVFHAIHRAFPATRLIEGMGMTECCSGIVYVDEAHMVEKRASVGRPVPHIDIRVVDDAENDVPVGELGELIIRGPKVSPGYWRDPEATAAAWVNGWLHSGDVARFDEDGYLYLVDRKKDMIKTGGENVASVEVEAVLETHPAVREVAVVGAPSERWGEVPFAAVVVSTEVSAEDLRDHCLASLAKFKVPADFKFTAELPRTQTGKIRKSEIREWAR
jgi:fatty-acyl-CoA synthase